MSQVTHLLHSLNPETGGVLSSVQLLSASINKLGITSILSDDPNYSAGNDETIIAHGLWQWPGRRARALQRPYLLFPHGMLDPWFKKTYFCKHLKKQLYWWCAQGVFYGMHTRFASPQKMSENSPGIPFPLTGLPGK